MLDSTDPALDLDAALRVVANEHRRRVLIALLDRMRREPGPSAVDPAHDPDAVPATVRTELYHVHLPKLDRAGLVEWDRNTGRVETGPRFERVRPLLELLVTHADELPGGGVRTGGANE